MKQLTPSPSPQELESMLQTLAESHAQQLCVRWVSRLLQDFPYPERLHFWRTSRGSLRGQTPLQALHEGALRQLHEAAEAFADA